MDLHFSITMPFLLAPRVLLEDSWPMITNPYRRPSKEKPLRCYIHLIWSCLWHLSTFAFLLRRSDHGVRKIGLVSARREKKRRSSLQRPTTGGQSESGDKINHSGKQCARSHIQLQMKIIAFYNNCIDTDMIFVSNLTWLDFQDGYFAQKFMHRDYFWSQEIM